MSAVSVPTALIFAPVPTIFRFFATPIVRWEVFIRKELMPLLRKSIGQYMHYCIIASLHYCIIVLLCYYVITKVAVATDIDDMVENDNEVSFNSKIHHFWNQNSSFLIHNSWILIENSWFVIHIELIIWWCIWIIRWLLTMWFSAVLISIPSPRRSVYI